MDDLEDCSMRNKIKYNQKNKTGALAMWQISSAGNDCGGEKRGCLDVNNEIPRWQNHGKDIKEYVCLRVYLLSQSSRYRELESTEIVLSLC